MPVIARSLIRSDHTMSPLIFQFGAPTMTMQTGAPVSFTDIGNGFDTFGLTPATPNYSIQVDFASNRTSGSAHWWITFKHYDQNNKWLLEFIGGTVRVGLDVAGVTTYHPGTPPAAPAHGNRVSLQLDYGDWWVKATDRATGTVLLAVQVPPPGSAPYDMRVGPAIGYYSSLASGEVHTWNNILGLRSAATAR